MTGRMNIRLLIAGMIVAAAGIFVILRSALFSAQIRNVVLVSIDTCRADYLSCYGYHRPTTPNIDLVADDGLLFVNAVSPVPLTLPAHCSMLTGTIPPTHGVHSNNGYRLSESQTSLAEIMKAQGFQTAAFVSAFVLDSRFGLDQGFDRYGDDFKEELPGNSITQRRGGETTREAIEWIDQKKDEKFFLFLHLYDPHARYEPPEPFSGLYRESLYAGEVAYADYCVGLVIEKLKSLGLYDSTLILITSDHGEMLGDHGELTHGYFIYQTAIRVPLTMKIPGRKKSATVTQPVGLIDIVPTICSLLDIQAPQRVQGEDLTGLLQQPQGVLLDRGLYCESLNPTKYRAQGLLGLVNDRWKYIQTARAELYDLLNDPAESRNLAEDDPRRAQFLKGRLKQIIAHGLRAGQDDNNQQVNTRHLDDETRKQLETLGYVGHADVREDFSFEADKDDPKDLLPFHLDHTMISALLLAEDYDKAKELCEKLLVQRPGLYQLHQWRGRIALNEKDYTTGLRHYREAAKLNPGDVVSHRQIGKVLVQLGKLSEAETSFQRSLDLENNHVGTLDNLARVYSRQGRIEDAYNQWHKVHQIEPGNTEIINNLAWMLAVYPDMDAHNPQESLRLAQRACELTNYKNATMLDTLAVAYGAAGDFTAAAEAAQNAYELALSDGQAELARQSKQHLELFKSSQPYRMSHTPD